MNNHDQAALLLIAECCIYDDSKIAKMTHAMQFVTLPTLQAIFQAVKEAGVYKLQMLTKARSYNEYVCPEELEYSPKQVSILLSECARPISIASACYTSDIDLKEFMRVRDNVYRTLAAGLELTGKQAALYDLLKAIRKARADGLATVLHNAHVAATCTPFPSMLSIEQYAELAYQIVTAEI